MIKLKREKRLITTRAPLSTTKWCPENFVMISLTVRVSGVIVLANKQTESQTDTAENDTTPAARVVKGSGALFWHTVYKQYCASLRSLSDTFKFHSNRLGMGSNVQGESKKVAHYDFRRYFRPGWVFLHKILYIYWQFISTYTDFCLFIFIFNEMTLILLRAPTNFTASSFDCSAISLLWKMKSTSLTKMMLLFSSSNV